MKLTLQQQTKHDIPILMFDAVIEQVAAVICDMGIELFIDQQFHGFLEILCRLATSMDIAT